MRLIDLPPPLTLSVAHRAAESVIGRLRRPARERGAALTSPARSRLKRPTVARSRARPLFHPGSGKLRRLERWISHHLSLKIFPRVPGITRLYGRQLEYDLTLSQAEIAVARLPPAFDGLRILLVTDPHAGPFVSPRDLERAFDRLSTVEPDLVLLGGDIATTCVQEFEQAARAFRRLRAPLGVYAVLGNHDHYTGDPSRLRRLVEAEGIHFVENRSVTIRRGRSRLWLAGVEDLMMGRPDLDAALDGWSGTEPCLLLSHHPDIFFEAAGRGVELVLSGHTHGGQVRIPGLPVLVRQSRFRLDEGRFRIGRSQLVVSRGLGVVGLPLRIACSPEAVLLRLRRAA